MKWYNKELSFKKKHNIARPIDVLINRNIYPIKFRMKVNAGFAFAHALKIGGSRSTIIAWKDAEIEQQYIAIIFVQTLRILIVV